MQQNRLNEKTRNRIIGYCFVLPALLYMIAFIGYPIIYNILISFQNVTAMTLSQSGRDFIGLTNYKSIASDPTFPKALLQTFYYTIGCLVFQFSIGFFLALFFCKNFSFAKQTRGFIVISWMLPVTVTALIFKFMLAEGNGVINLLLLQLNIIDKPIGWLIYKETAMWGVIIANSWIGIPFNMLLLTSGLNNIPQEVYEASSIDGANSFQRFTKITLPLLKPTMMSVLVLGFVYTFKVFDLVYVMTAGGPVDATEVMSTYSYRLSFKFYQFGQGAAVANVLFICLFFVALLYLKTITKEEVI
ncbi:MAG: sugar ABC transporter permease [Spirochaetales bacterium]